MKCLSVLWCNSPLYAHFCSLAGRWRSLARVSDKLIYRGVVAFVFVFTLLNNITSSGLFVHMELTEQDTQRDRTKHTERQNKTHRETE